MKKAAFIIFLAIFSNTILSQDLMKRISSETELVIEFGMDKLDQIYSHKKLFKNEMWQDLAKEGKMKSMLETGIDYAKPGYFTVDITDTCTYFSFHFNLANKKQFLSLITPENSDFEIKQDYKGSGYTCVSTNKESYAFFNEKSATISFAVFNDKYEDDQIDYLMEIYHEEVKRYEYEHQQKEVIENIFGRNYAYGLLTNKYTSFDKSECYKMLNEKEEINVYVNKLYSQLGKAIKDRDVKQFSNLFSMFDSYQTYSFAMDNGQLNVNISMDFPVDTKESIQAIVAGRSLNEDFLKFIPKDRMGVYMMSMNPRAYYDWMKKSIANALGGSYIQSESVADIIDLIETIIDEESISNIVSGDVLFSFNGIEKSISEYTYSDFDENFEQIEKTRNQEVEFPELTLIIGVKNERFFQKILDILKRENLVKQEEGYLFVPSNREFPTGFGIRLENDKLIISNDMELFERIYKKNWYATNPIEKNLSFYGELKLDEVFKKALEEVESYTDYTFLSTMSKTFSGIQIKSVQHEKGIGASGSLNFVDTKKNAYISIVEMLNELYMLNETDRKEGKFNFYATRLNKLILEYEALPSDKKSTEGDEVLKNCKELLKSKEAKEEPGSLREAYWLLEEIINWKSFLDYEHYDENYQEEEVIEEK